METIGKPKFIRCWPVSGHHRQSVQTLNINFLPEPRSPETAFRVLEFRVSKESWNTASSL